MVVSSGEEGIPSPAQHLVAVAPPPELQDVQVLHVSPPVWEPHQLWVCLFPGSMVTLWGARWGLGWSGSLFK